MIYENIMRRILMAFLISAFSLQFYQQSKGRELGKVPTFYDQDDVSEFIKIKENLSKRISSCFSPNKSQPNVYFSQGESLPLPFLDYICLIDNKNLLLVMEDWVGINKLDDFTKNKEVFRKGDQISLIGKDPDAELDPFQKIVKAFQEKYPRIPDHRFRVDPNKKIVKFDSIGTNNVAYIQKEKATNIYRDYAPNVSKISKVDNQKKEVYYCPYSFCMDDVVSKFSEVRNLTYNPKPGFENNKFIVDKLEDKKFKISLVGVKDKPYIDFVWGAQKQSKELADRYKGIEYNEICNNQLYQSRTPGQCAVRQFIEGHSICDFGEIENFQGNIKCLSIGSFGKEWKSYLKSIDNNLVTGIVASMIKEDQRFKRILQ